MLLPMFLQGVEKSLDGPQVIEFHGVVTQPRRWLRGRFFNVLGIDDGGLRLRPRCVPKQRRSEQSSPDRIFAFAMNASLPLIRFGATIGIALMTIRSRCAARCDEGRARV
jgi:hypothetical protein